MSCTAATTAAAKALTALKGKKHTLYWNPLCPFVHRALIVMEEKGCADVAERVFISLEEDAPEWYRKINPAETVPTLVVDGEPTLFESSFIAEYFDRTFGAPDALLPPVASVRKAIREFQDECGEVVGALYGVFFSDDQEAALKRGKAAVAQAEKTLAAATAANGGPYFLGTQFSMADIHIVPFLQRFSVTLPAFRNFEPFADAPALRRLRDAAVLRPSVFSTSQTSVEYVNGYAAYGGKEAPLTKAKVELPAGSPFGLRVTVAAALAGLPVDATFVKAADAGDARLPAVTFAGTTARDSGKALEYLLDANRKSAEPAAPLVPADSVQLGRAQFIAQSADELGTAIIMSRKANASGEAKAAVAQVLKTVEGLLAGPWAAGAEVSFADAVLLPHLALLDAGELEAAPKARAIFEAGCAKPAVKAALDAGSDAEALKAFVESA